MRRHDGPRGPALSTMAAPLRTLTTTGVALRPRSVAAPVLWPLGPAGIALRLSLLPI